jgi:nitroreductase
MPVNITENSPELAPLVADRWSPKLFRDQNVEREKVVSLLEAARWAPSSYNEQPWRFVVGNKGHGLAYDKIFGVLEPVNQSWAQTAPVLIAVCAKKTLSRNGKKNNYAWYDTGQAVANLTMQAGTQGLYLRQIGGFFPSPLCNTLDVPEDFEPVVVLAIGYLSDEFTHLNGRAPENRMRRPLQELAFTDDWGLEFM